MAVGSAAAGEDDSSHVIVSHRFEEGEGAGDVVSVVEAGVVHRLTDKGAGGKVEDGEGLIFGEKFGEENGVSEVALDQGTPADEIGMTCGEVVEADRQETGQREPLTGVAADIASATSY